MYAVSNSYDNAVLLNLLSSFIYPYLIFIAIYLYWLGDGGLIILCEAFDIAVTIEIIFVFTNAFIEGLLDMLSSLAVTGILLKVAQN